MPTYGPGLPGEGKGYPGSWPGEFHGLYMYIIHGVTKSHTRLSDSHSLTHGPKALLFWGFKT